MEVGSAGAASVSTAPQVAVANKAKDQQEAVASTILAGVEQGSRAAEQTGQRLTLWLKKPGS